MTTLRKRFEWNQFIWKVIPGITRKEVKTWDKEGETASEQCIISKVHCGQLKPKPLRNSGRQYQGCLRVAQTEKQGCWSTYSPTPIHHGSAWLGSSWRFQPKPQRKPWGRRLLVFEIRGCCYAQEWQRGCEQGNNSVGPKLINISLMNAWM